MPARQRRCGDGGTKGVAATAGRIRSRRRPATMRRSPWPLGRRRTVPGPLRPPEGTCLDNGRNASLQKRLPRGRALGPRSAETRRRVLATIAKEYPPDAQVALPDRRRCGRGAAARSRRHRLPQPRFLSPLRTRRDRHLRQPVLGVGSRRAARRGRGLPGGRVLHRGRRRHLEAGRDRHPGVPLLGLHGRPAPRLGGRAARHDPAHRRRRQDLEGAAEPQEGGGLAPVRRLCHRLADRLGRRRVGDPHSHARRGTDLDRPFAHDHLRPSPVRVARLPGPGEGSKGREGLRGRRSQQRLLSPLQPGRVLDRGGVRLHLPLRGPGGHLDSRRDRGRHPHRSRFPRPTPSDSRNSPSRSKTPRTSTS
jgi:hypothetical protein